MDRQDLIQSGYVKSGNTYLARLLGDALDSPVTGYKNARPIAEEGLDRPGGYTVRQLHLKLSHGEHAELMPDANTFAAKLWRGQRVAFVLRDPRDVAVSVMHYWQIHNLDDALQAMLHGVAPLIGVGAWKRFVVPWLESNIPCIVRYEDLVRDPVSEIEMLLGGLGIPIPPLAKLKETVARQSFDKRREELEANGDQYNYGKAIQLRNLRKGQPGDWVNYFTRRQAQIAALEWGPLLDELGYESDPTWWQEVGE